MVEINLLPWREKAHIQRQWAFMRTLLISCLLCAAVLACWFGYNLDSINLQKQRNHYLRTQLKQVGDVLQEIDRLEKLQQDLAARIQVVNNLQSSRPLSVRLLDELVKVSPPGVQLTQMAQSGNSITLLGRAESNARVSALMRNIEASIWLGQPELGVIEQKSRPAQQPGSGIRDFSLGMQLGMPLVPREIQQ